MATDLVIHGPIPIPFKRLYKTNKQIQRKDALQFSVVLKEDHLYYKHGCYVFALKAGKGFSPWYVGKSSKCLGQECMAEYQRNLYNELLVSGRKGLPVMFFVAAPDKLNKVPAVVCDELETVLIQSAHARNPDLLNSRKKKIADWTVRGIIRSGKGKVSQESRVFKNMIGL